MDEARHVEVYSKYLKEKLEWEFPVNIHLRELLDDVIRDPRWDFTYLGMQIMVEGLALAAFGFQYQFSPDPLLKQITRYVMSDEARHVAFGVLSLQEAYQSLSAAEIRERQEFCYEAAVRMRDRFLQQEVWEALGMPVKECCEIMLHNGVQLEFRKVLFSKIVPNLKKLGLLDAGDGWLRAASSASSACSSTKPGRTPGPNTSACNSRRRSSRADSASWPRRRSDPDRSEPARRYAGGLRAAPWRPGPGASRRFLRRIRSCFHRTVDRAPRPMGGAG